MKAVIYARYSSDSQREESIEGQLRECKEYAERNGITVLSAYIDRALSAKTDNRPEFQRMIKDSAKGLFDIVLVWKLDRFARNRYDSAHYKAILKKNGAKVVSAKEAIAEDSTGILLESLLEGYAEFYSVELSEKIHRGQKENALKGLNNGGGIPLGYLLGKDQRLEVDPITAPLVVEIFSRYAEGETIRAIVDSLNERGLQTKRNKPYTMSSFNSILKNRKYIGEYKYQDVVIPGGVPSIVPQELFDRVQARMEKNKRAPAMSKADEKFLLTTKLFCGKCGRLMVGESGTSHTGKKHYYYKCGSAKRKTGCTKKAVKKDWIENLVVGRTMRMIFDDRTLAAIAEMVLEVQSRESTSLPVLKRQLAQAEQGIENMLNAIQQGLFTSSTKHRLEELEATKERLTVSILQEELKKPHLTKEQILFFLNRFRAIDISKPEQRQHLIDSFVNAVYVYDDKIILTFNYKDGTEAITLDDIKGSDLEAACPPKAPTERLVLFSLLFDLFTLDLMLPLCYTVRDINKKENEKMAANHIKEQMHSGELYDPADESIMEEQFDCQELLYEYNQTRPHEQARRTELLRRMFAEIGDNCYIEPPFHANWGGHHVHFGKNVYANFNLTMVDDTHIFVGDYTMFGPNVTVASAGHPINPELRQRALQYNMPVHIGKNCWIGAGVIVVPGVTIGDNVVVGAGSVVTKDLPDNVVAVGNPCRVLRPVSEHDREFYFKNRRIPQDMF